MLPQSSLLLAEHISSTLHVSVRIHSQHAMNSLRGLHLEAISPRVKKRMIQFSI